MSTYVFTTLGVSGASNVLAIVNPAAQVAFAIYKATNSATQNQLLENAARAYGIASPIFKTLEFIKPRIMKQTTSQQTTLDSRFPNTTTVAGQSKTNRLTSAQLR
jgi:hypothetical protein